MNVRFAAVACGAWFGLCSLAFADPEVDASALFETTCQDVESAKAADSYSEAFQHYERAQENIRLLLTEPQYKSSKIAVGLRSNKKKIAGLKLKKLQKLGAQLESLSEAEQSLLSFAEVNRDEIIDLKDKNVGTILIAAGYAAVGHFQKALATVDAIDGERWRTEGYIRVASRFTAAGATEEAIEILDQKTEQVLTSKTQTGYSKTLARLGVQYAEAGEEDKAAQLLAHAVELAGRIKKPYDRADALHRIAREYLDLGQKAKACQALSQALTATNSVKDQDVRAGLKTLIAVGYAEAGRAAEAVETAKLLDEPDKRSATLGAVGAVLVQNGQLAESLEVADSISNKPELFVVLVQEIASEFFKAGQKKEAIELLSRASESIAKIKSSRGRVLALAWVSAAYLDGGLEKEGTELLSQATDVAEAVDDPAQKVGLLVPIANTYQAAGKNEDADMLRSLAASLVPSIEKLVLEGITSLVLSDSYSRAGQDEEAAKWHLWAINCAAVWNNTDPADHRRLAILKAIVQSDAEGHRLEQAVQTAKYIVPDNRSYPSAARTARDSALVSISKLCLEAGQFTLAMEAIQEIEEPADLATALVFLSNAYAAAGKQPGDEVKDFLRAKVSTTHPRDSFWR